MRFHDFQSLFNRFSFDFEGFCTFLSCQRLILALSRVFCPSRGFQSTWIILHSKRDLDASPKLIRNCSTCHCVASEPGKCRYIVLLLLILWFTTEWQTQYRLTSLIRKPDRENSLEIGPCVSLLWLNAVSHRNCSDFLWNANWLFYDFLLGGPFWPLSFVCWAAPKLPASVLCVKKGLDTFLWTAKAKKKR